MDDHYHYHYHPCPIGIDAPGVQYTFTRVHARIHNGHLREENRACRTRRRTSRRGSSCVSGSDERASVPQLTASCSCSWQAERTTRRHSRDDPRDDVGVRVGLVELPLYTTSPHGWRFSAVVASFVARTKLLNVEPG